MHESKVHLYSPYEPRAYTRPDNDTDNPHGLIGVGTEFDSPERRAAWNLYWLSDPVVDSFLLDDVEWRAKEESINTDLVGACIKAAHQNLGGVMMAELLVYGSPGEFAEHLRRHKHTHLAPYKLLGAAWVMTVAERAADARGLLIQEGNLYTACFTRKPTLPTFETFETKGATIMPLALRMKLQ